MNVLGKEVAQRLARICILSDGLQPCQRSATEKARRKNNTIRGSGHYA